MQIKTYNADQLLMLNSLKTVLAFYREWVVNYSERIAKLSRVSFGIKKKV